MLTQTIQILRILLRLRIAQDLQIVQILVTQQIHHMLVSLQQVLRIIQTQVD